MGVAEHTAAVERAKAAWNAGDLDGYLEFHDVYGDADRICIVFTMTDILIAQEVIVVLEDGTALKIFLGPKATR